MSFQSFCTVQNLSGIYSLVMHTFICHAQGKLLHSTNETSDIHWESVGAVKETLETEP